MRVRRLAPLLGALLAATAPATASADGTAIEALDAAGARGAKVFRRYCVLCHGARAQGDGVAAKNLNPRPANLTVSVLSDANKEAIIRNGGASVGRSASMPPWRHELSDRQIHDLIDFLGQINVAKR